jgi:hypothetical protein
MADFKQNDVEDHVLEMAEGIKALWNTILRAIASHFEQPQKLATAVISDRKSGDMGVFRGGYRNAAVRWLGLNPRSQQPPQQNQDMRNLLLI